MKKSDQTKDKILAAALDEFASKGFAGTRVDQIAQAAGVNKAMIYYHFSGKQDLFDQLFDRLALANNRIIVGRARLLLVSLLSLVFHHSLDKLTFVLPRWRRKENLLSNRRNKHSSEDQFPVGRTHP